MEEPKTNECKIMAICTAVREDTCKHYLKSLGFNNCSWMTSQASAEFYKKSCNNPIAILDALNIIV